jgi:hypothetical protein
VSRSVASRWQQLLHISFSWKSFTSQVLLKGVQRDGNHWAPHGESDLWLVYSPVAGNLSSNLTPSDFNLHRPVIKHLAGKQFGTNTNMKLTVTSWLQTVFAVRIQASVPQWDIHLNVNDDYAEVWCVPSATHVPCIHGSQSSSRHQSVYYCLKLSFGALIPIHFSMCNKAESQITPYVSKLLWNVAQTWLCYRPFTNPNTNIIPSKHTHTHKIQHPVDIFFLYKKWQKWEIQTALRGHTMLQILRINVWKSRWANILTASQKLYQQNNSVTFYLHTDGLDNVFDLVIWLKIRNN